MNLKKVSIITGSTIVAFGVPCQAMDERRYLRRQDFMEILPHLLAEKEQQEFAEAEAQKIAEQEAAQEIAEAAAQEISWAAALFCNFLEIAEQEAEQEARRQAGEAEEEMKNSKN